MFLICNHIFSYKTPVNISVTRFTNFACNVNVKYMYKCLLSLYQSIKFNISLFLLHKVS